MISTAIIPSNKSGYMIMPPYCRALQALLSSCIAKSSRVFSAPERRASSALHVFTFFSFYFCRVYCMGGLVEGGRGPLFFSQEAAGGAELGGGKAGPRSFMNVLLMNF